MLNQDMKDLINLRQCMVATCAEDGTPNIGPKGSVMVIDDSTLAYGEICGKQTYKNLNANQKISIAAVDFKKLAGYRFVCTAAINTDGPLYDKMVSMFVKMKMPNPIAAITAKIDKIYDLSVKNPGGLIS